MCFDTFDKLIQLQNYFFTLKGNFEDSKKRKGVTLQFCDTNLQYRRVLLSDYTIWTTCGTRYIKFVGTYVTLRRV